MCFVARQLKGHRRLPGPVSSCPDPGTSVRVLYDQGAVSGSDRSLTTRSGGNAVKTRSAKDLLNQFLRGKNGSSASTVAQCHFLDGRHLVTSGAVLYSGGFPRLSGSLWLCSVEGARNRGRSHPVQQDGESGDRLHVP